MNIGEGIDFLLNEKGFITNRELRALTGLTRQAVCSALNRLVHSGALIRSHCGRSLRYRRFDAADLNSETPRWQQFWTDLGRETRRLRYVRVSLLSLRHDRRADAEALAPLLSVASPSHLVLDFENVDEASVRYLRRLVFEIPGPGCAVMPINLNPLLRQRLADAQRCNARSGDLSNDLDC